MKLAIPAALVAFATILSTTALAQSASSPIHDVNDRGRQPFQRFFYPTMGANSPNGWTFDLSAPVPPGKRLVIEYLQYLPPPSCADRPILYLSDANGPKFYFQRGSEYVSQNVLLYVNAGDKPRIWMNNECSYGVGRSLLLTGHYVDIAP